MCYYFNDIIKLEDIDFDNILIAEKLHESTLIYDISFKTLFGPKPFRIRFDKIDGFMRVYGGTRYLVLLGLKKIDVIYNRIRYLINLKIGITYTFSHYYAKIKVDSHDSLPIENILTLHNVIILIKSKSLGYKIFLEKYLYQLA